MYSAVYARCLAVRSRCSIETSGRTELVESIASTLGLSSTVIREFVYMTFNNQRTSLKVTGLLNFRKLAKPSMLAAMTVSPLAGLSGFDLLWTSSSAAANRKTDHSNEPINRTCK